MGKRLNRIGVHQLNEKFNEVIGKNGHLVLKSGEVYLVDFISLNNNHLNVNGLYGRKVEYSLDTILEIILDYKAEY